MQQTTNLSHYSAIRSRFHARAQFLFDCGLSGDELSKLKPHRDEFANSIVAGEHGFDYTPRPCDDPTNHMPGSAAKFIKLVERAEQGVELWHPMDAGMERVRSTEQRRIAADGATESTGRDKAAGCAVRIR